MGDIVLAYVAGIFSGGIAITGFYMFAEALDRKERAEGARSVSVTVRPPKR